jgi:nicotinamidase-related amidase
MKKFLVLVDYQNDFIDGSLGTKEAVVIHDKVLAKVQAYPSSERLATLDTHYPDYLDTQEGKNLPVMHCQQGTKGWEMQADADKLEYHHIFEKNTFGSTRLAEYIAKQKPDQVELIGICTDICVVSNALLIKAFAPEVKLIVDSSCCAATTPEAQTAALSTLKSCQVEILNETKD